MAKRDQESFDHHLEHVVAGCCKTWLVLKSNTLLGDQYLLIPKRCKSNYCPTCRKENLYRLRKAMFISMRKDKWRLCTLTFPDHTKNIEEALHESTLQFKRLTRALRKMQPNIKYIRSIEVHKSGFIHLHCVFNKFIPISFISEEWKKAGGGIADIRATNKCKICHKPPPCEHVKTRKKLGYRAAARYLTEEIEKTQQDPHTLGFVLWKNRVRTIATSRNIKLSPPTHEYQYIGNYASLTQAYELYEKLECDAEVKNGCKPSLKLGKNSVTFGQGGHWNNNPAEYNPTKAPKIHNILKQIDEARNSIIFPHANESFFKTLKDFKHVAAQPEKQPVSPHVP